MNKFGLFRRMIVALPIVLLSCSASQEVSARLTLHTTPLYTIGVPQEWHVLVLDETLPLVTFVSPESIPDEFAETVYSGDEWIGPGFLVYIPMEPPPSWDVIDAEWLLSPEDELLEEQEGLIDGRVIHQVIYRTEQEGRQAVRWTALVLGECAVKAGFVLEATAPAEEWDEYWPLFQAIRDSFVTHGKWPEPPVAMDTYEGEAFHINYYQGWEARSEEDRIYFGNALPAYHNFLVMVSGPLEATPEDLSEFMYRDETIVLEGSVEIAGREGYELVEMVEGECAYMEWHATVVGGSPPRFYDFYASADADVWEQRAWPLIQEMRDSFEIIGGD